MELFASGTASDAAVAFAVTVPVSFTCYFIKFILLESLSSFISPYDSILCGDGNNSNKNGAVTRTTT